MAKRKHCKTDWGQSMRAMKVGDEVIIEPKGIAEKTLRAYIYGLLAKRENKKWSMSKVYKIKRTK